MGNWLTDGSPATAAINKENQRNSFEETTIKRLLKQADVKYNLTQWRKDAASMNGGVHFLTFDWFADQFPQFPVQLGAARIKWTHKIVCGDLFGSGFAKLPFFKEYRTFLDQAGVDLQTERAGLVFNWTGVRAGGSAMVLHNYPVSSHNVPDPDSRVERGTRIVRPFGNPVVVFVIESMTDFSLSIGTDWATE